MSSPARAVTWSAGARRTQSLSIRSGWLGSSRRSASGSTWQNLINTGRAPLIAVDGGEVVGIAIAGPPQEVGAPAAFSFTRSTSGRSTTEPALANNSSTAPSVIVGCLLWVARQPARHRLLRPQRLCARRRRTARAHVRHPDHPDGAARSHCPELAPRVLSLSKDRKARRKDARIQLFVVIESGRPGGQPLDRNLELRVQVDKGPGTGQRATPG